MFSSGKSKTRLLTGVILGLIVLWCFLNSGLALLLIVSVFIVLAAIEFVKILENKGFYPSLKVILFVNALFAISAYFNRFDLAPVIFMVGTISAFMGVLFAGRQPYIANISSTLLGFVYSGWFPLHVLLLRDLNSDYPYRLLKLNVQNDGLGYVTLVFFAILLTDVGAYCFGSRFGKHKLSPTVSPNKTVEGAIGGALCAIAASFFIGYFINLAWYHCLIVGILVTFFAQIGDLSESLMKRDAGVKDSGSLLPGHGGFLDCCDSFVFTIPVAYYYFNYFVISNQLWLDFVDFSKGILNVFG